MRGFAAWIRNVAFIALILISLSLVAAQGQNSPYAVVSSVEGYADVKFSTREQYVPLKENTNLGVGDIIKTDDEGKVVLKLPDKSMLIIGENSRVVIKELGMVELTKVSVSTFEIIKRKDPCDSQPVY